ncbi:hypothetical protein FOA43_000045 [Brettanomyces nanus]|uniref:HIG1 domain-containing protein n=1 Tax=Eeniella nana TaxID=13502 RepID=A0A875RZV1_EENNA|nr:uncharacterized protein FOA43_000045 [Brettanomyces nanus]QPG72744.1 hypothetical protein FOA43_000045 [Brettanomyces nanus]
MKVINKEERAAHDAAVKWGGAKGLVIGTAVSCGLYVAARFRYKKILALTASAKTAIFVTPPAFLISLYGELASNGFDRNMYSSESSQRAIIEEHKKWDAMSTKNKITITLNDNKYKIITGLWALSLWGSWEYASRDKLLSRAQKFYDARMYAQFITILLLLGSIGLSVQDENKAKGKKLTNQDRYLNEMMSSEKE